MAQDALLRAFLVRSIRMRFPETVIVHPNSYAEFLYYFESEHNPIVADMVKCVYSDWSYLEKMRRRVHRESNRATDVLKIFLL
ncbi:hypothetical protein RUND412_004362 [Rhizina undulata]